MFVSVLAISNANLFVIGADDLVIERFNRDNYGDWKASGDAFQPGPARGSQLLYRLDIENSEGNLGAGAVTGGGSGMALAEQIG